MGSLSGFMPHGMCFLWRPDILALHVASDAFIALAYFSIPLMLVRFVRARADVPFSSVFWMFSIFIVSCGLTHVMAIVVIWAPLYWIEGTIKAFTAVSSVATAMTLVPLLPKALALRTPAELERVNAKLQASIDQAAALLRRYEREHYIATTLQSASLGDIPAQLGALHLSAMYQPGVGDLEIGGDWYDAFRLPDGRTVVSIGDVAGKGLAASVIMAKMRQAIRVAANVQVMPSAILDAADRSLVLEHPDAVVTAFVGIVDDDEALLVYANAGHPSPLLCSPDGRISELRADGLPLGLRGHEGRETARDASAALESGALLVLYTDGVIESTHDLVEGERRLRGALTDPAVTDSADPARAIRDAVLFDGVRDDVAILAMRFVPPPAPERWTFASTDGDAAHATRAQIVRHLRTIGATPDEIFAAELIFGELIGNVARHATGTVDVRLSIRDGVPVLHVLDRGTGFAFVPGLPSDLLAESGRGLYIVSQMTRDFVIIPRPDGGSHARAVLPVYARTVRFTAAARAASELSTDSIGGGGDVKPIASS